MGFEVDDINESLTTFRQDHGDTFGEPPLKWWQFWKRFSATGRNFDLSGPSPVRGDVIKTDDVAWPETLRVVKEGHMGFHLPRSEYNRRKRYKDYEDMDEYPEIAAALDMYADDGSLKDIKREMIKVTSTYEPVKREIQKLFKQIKIDDIGWDVIRNLCKYGDCFVENVVDLNNKGAGIKRIKVLNPNYIIRMENEFGELKQFAQEVPTNVAAGMGGYRGAKEGQSLIPIDKNQVIHWKITTSDMRFYPYGKPITAPASRTYKSLRMMEDSMLIMRLKKAPLRRAFYIDIGSLPASKAENFMDKMKQKFKKEKYFDSQSGKVEERFNPWSADEDFFIPVRPNSKTEIKDLPGVEGLGEIDDVKYFREKILAAMKIPKEYFSMQDKSTGNSTASELSQMDIKYSRAVERVQREFLNGLKTLVKRHLALAGFSYTYIKSFDLEMIKPSDAEAKKKLELDEQKARTVQALKGLELFPDTWFYKEYFGLEEEEIEEVQKEKKAQDLEAQEQEMAMQPPMMDMMGGGMPMGGEGVPETEKGAIRGSPGTNNSDQS